MYNDLVTPPACQRNRFGRQDSQVDGGEKVSGQKLQQLPVDWAFMSKHCVNGENTARVTKWCDGLPKAFQSTRSRLVGETISNSFIAKMSTSTAQ